MTRGGDFVGQGTYGCSFSPAVPCLDGRPLGKKLGKVFASQTSAVKEFASVDLLRRIDPQQKLFVYPNETCDVNRGTMAAEPHGDMCVFATADPRDTLTQLLMDNGGVTAAQFFYFMYKDATRASIAHIIEHAFYAVKQLINVKYVHQDIKPANMVIMAGNNPKRMFESRLIDFGTLVHFDKYADFNQNLFMGRTYFLSPPEYRVMGKVLRLTPETDVKIERELLEKAVPPHVIVDAGIFSQAYADSLAKLNNELAGKNRINRIKAFKAMNVADKSDVYSLGVTLLMLERFAMPLVNDDPRAVRLFHGLIQGCMVPHPVDRWSIDDAIKALKALKKYSTYDPKQRIAPANKTAQLLSDVHQSKYFQDIFKKGTVSPRRSPSVRPTTVRPTTVRPTTVRPPTSPSSPTASASRPRTTLRMPITISLDARVSQSVQQPRSSRRETQVE